MDHRFRFGSCPVPKNAHLTRATVGWGVISVLGAPYFATWLVFLRDHFQRRVTVSVAIDPDDRSRCWAFHPLAQRWIEVPPLNPDDLGNQPVGPHLRKPGRLKKPGCAAMKAA